MRGSQAIASQIQGGGRASVPIPNHLIPSRDSVGSSPARFEWSAVPGADSYSIGVWNEVDMMIWRVDHVQGTSVDTGTQKFDPGTYFWTISAVKDGEEISASGLAAFVVRPNTP
jgi:hypothetical protein